ncbi:TspO/MBR family protein [Azospirillum sp. sgz302134]
MLDPKRGRSISLSMTWHSGQPFAPTDTGRLPFRVRWWHALLFWLLANLYGFFERGTEPFPGYQPSPLQPPGWAFPVVWFTISLIQLWGDVRLLNAPWLIRHRAALIGLQGALWLLYFSFGFAYFTMGSPILAAAWTLSYFIIAGFCVAFVWPDDKAIAASWTPLVLWTGFASVVAVHGVLLNPDPLFMTPAYLG